MYQFINILGNIYFLGEFAALRIANCSPNSVCMCERVFVYAYTYPLEDGLFHMLKLIALGIYISSTKNSRNKNFVSGKKLDLLVSL